MDEPGEPDTRAVKKMVAKSDHVLVWRDSLVLVLPQCLKVLKNCTVWWLEDIDPFSRPCIPLNIMVNLGQPFR